MTWMKALWKQFVEYQSSGKPAPDSFVRIQKAFQGIRLHNLSRDFTLEALEYDYIKLNQDALDFIQRVDNDLKKDENVPACCNRGVYPFCSQLLDHFPRIHTDIVLVLIVFHLKYNDILSKNRVDNPLGKYTYYTMDTKGRLYPRLDIVAEYVEN